MKNRDQFWFLDDGNTIVAAVAARFPSSPKYKVAIKLLDWGWIGNYRTIAGRRFIETVPRYGDPL